MLAFNILKTNFIIFNASLFNTPNIKTFIFFTTSLKYYFLSFFIYLFYSHHPSHHKPTQSHHKPMAQPTTPPMAQPRHINHTAHQPTFPSHILLASTHGTPTTNPPPLPNNLSNIKKKRKKRRKPPSVS